MIELYYPYNEGEYGINLPSLPAQNSRFTGESGNVLYGYADENTIVVSDAVAYFEMVATVKGHFLSHEIQTRATTPSYKKQLNGSRHPDMFAAHFIRYSYNYFIARGVAISGIEALIVRGSDTFRQFVRKHEVMGDIEALKSTWAGKQYEQLGFSEIKPENISLSFADKKNGPTLWSVSAIFTQPTK